MIEIPKAKFTFGQRVVCKWHEAEAGESIGFITGIDFDHRRDTSPLYTITEENGAQTDFIDEPMLREWNPELPPTGTPRT